MWQDHPMAATLDMYRAYMAENLRTWSRSQPPSAAWPATRSQTLPFIVFGSANPQGRRAELTVVCITVERSWAIALLRDTAPITEINLKRCVKIIPIITADTYEFWDGPLSPGTYYYRYIEFTFDGNQDPLSDEKSVVIA